MHLKVSGSEMDETATMLSLQGLIVWWARRFSQHDSSLDTDELIGEGQLVALKAIRQYHEQHPAGTTPSSYVSHALRWYYLGNSRNKGWRARMRKPNTREYISDVGYHPQTSLMSEVSDKAAAVIGFVIHYGYKKTALQELLQGMQWEKEETQRVFQEIRDAL